MKFAHTHENLVEEDMTPPERLFRALNAATFGNEKAKQAFLKIIQDVNCGRIKPSDIAMDNNPSHFSDRYSHRLDELYEVLLTLRDYDMLRAVFDCEFIP